MDAATLAAFQDAVRTALLAALVIALHAAVVVALALSARIVEPDLQSSGHISGVFLRGGRGQNRRGRW
jgi:hypothetical protein